MQCTIYSQIIYHITLSTKQPVEAQLRDALLLTSVVKNTVVGFTSRHPLDKPVFSIHACDGALIIQHGSAVYRDH